MKTEPIPCKISKEELVSGKSPIRPRDAPYLYYYVIPLAEKERKSFIPTSSSRKRKAFVPKRVIKVAKHLPSGSKEVTRNESIGPLKVNGQCSLHNVEHETRISCIKGI